MDRVELSQDAIIDDHTHAMPRRALGEKVLQGAGLPRATAAGDRGTVRGGPEEKRGQGAKEGDRREDCSNGGEAECGSGEPGEGAEGPGHLGITETPLTLNEDDRVDDHHRSPGGHRPVEREKTAQARHRDEVPRWI